MPKNCHFHARLLQNGVLSAIPYLLNWIFALFSARLADYTIARGWLSRCAVRKVCNAVGSLGPGAAFVAMAFIGCDSALAVGLLCIGFMLKGAASAGIVAQHWACLCD